MMIMLSLFTVLDTLVTLVVKDFPSVFFGQILGGLIIYKLM